MNVQINQKDPLVRLDSGLWGLNDRDVKITRKEQNELVEKIVSILEKRRAGISGADLEQIMAPLTERKVPIQQLISLACFDSRLEFNMEQGIRLASWN